MKKLITILILIVTGISSNAQNTNVRAQGNYYSAKTNFQAKNYTESLKYVYKCKTALGGTNRELQYLHILNAYYLYKWEEAAKQLQKYFDMEEKKIVPVRFDKSVDLLTSDETKALSMLIDPILESYEKWKDNPCVECHGTGIMDKILICENCNGNGNIKENCTACSAGKIKCSNNCNNGYFDCKCKGCSPNGCCDGANLCNEGTHQCNNCGNMFNGSWYEFRGKCRRCNKGKVVCSVCSSSGNINCKVCNGSGYLIKTCSVCNNTGKVRSLTEKQTCNKCYGKGF